MKHLFFLAAVATVTILSLACQSGANDGQRTAVIRGEPPSEIRIIGVGGGEPSHERPIRVTEGRYVPPGRGPDAANRLLGLQAAEAGKPVFSGTVNGFRLISILDDAVVQSQQCPDNGKIGEFPLVEELTFDYLPPGTFAETPQYAGLCPDGSVGFIAQRFGGEYFFLEIGFNAGERALRNGAPAERVSPGSVRGKPAVFIHPIDPFGFDRSIVYFATPRGYIVVAANGLPFGETLKIAQGVSCKSC